MTSVTHVITLPPCGFKDPLQLKHISKEMVSEKANDNHLSIVSVFLLHLSPVTTPQLLWIIIGGRAVE